MKKICFSLCFCLSVILGNAQPELPIRYYSENNLINIRYYEPGNRVGVFSVSFGYEDASVTDSFKITGLTYQVYASPNLIQDITTFDPNGLGQHPAITPNINTGTGLFEPEYISFGSGRYLDPGDYDYFSIQVPLDDITEEGELRAEVNFEYSYWDTILHQWVAADTFLVGGTVYVRDIFSAFSTREGMTIETDNLSSENILGGVIKMVSNFSDAYLHEIEVKPAGLMGASETLPVIRSLKAMRGNQTIGFRSFNYVAGTYSLDFDFQQEPLLALDDTAEIKIFVDMGGDVWPGNEFKLGISVGLRIDPIPALSIEGNTYAYQQTRMWDAKIEFGHPTGIAEASDGEMAVYPNPATSFVTIVSGLSDWQCAIYDAVGKLVMSEKHITDPTFQVDCSDFPRGMYTARITDANGKALMRKVMMQR